jgi:hypothetical protein
MTDTNEPRSRGRAIVEWFWRGRALARARARAGEITREKRDLLDRARTAFDLGGRSLAPDGSLPSGSAGVAAELFRQAAYWALLSRTPALGRPSAQALWSASDQSVLLEAAGGPDDLAAIRPLAEACFTDFADRPSAEQRAAADQLERFASRLIAAGRQPLTLVEEARIQRLFGISLFVVCVIAAIMLVTVGYRRITKKPNLAAGKPWTASSEFAKCHPEAGDCGGTNTNILFHTKSDDNPWFEYDFGTPLRFSSMTIVNRQDFGPERAVPLIVEVSNDKKTYSEIARRTEVFDTWHPKFATQQARYLRVRVGAVSWLHLEAVEVHP